MTYSTVDDLLTGDMTLGSNSRPNKYVEDATNEIDSCLGYRYVLPLPDTIPVYSKLLLNRCANFLASGRLIMALAVGGEDSALHAYGLSLVQEGQLLLEQLCSGSTDIPGATLTDPLVAGLDLGPTLGNQDASSSVDAFYAYVGGCATTLWWQPGTQPL